MIDVLSYRRLLGFCPQKPNFERSLTVEENLIFAGRYYLMALRKLNVVFLNYLNSLSLLPMLLRHLQYFQGDINSGYL